MSVADRVVVITGGAFGIGRAVAAGFAGQASRVWILDVDDAAGSATAGSIEGATFLTCDVTSERAVAAAARTIEDECSSVDVLVNNAGGFSEQRSFESSTLDEWKRIVDLNLTSVFLVTKALLPLLRRSEAGRVVNIGSLAGQTAGYRTDPAYAAAKGGVHALTRALAWELAPSGITVNALAPSAVLTERIEALRDEAEREATASSIPLGRYQTPDELAAWVVCLACPEAGFMTGQTVSVNGGRFMA